MSAPSFTLPACAYCSSLVRAERPYWAAARHTTAKRGKTCFILIGCKHAVPSEQVGMIREAPEECAIVEDTWEREAEVLFARYTEKWTESARERYRKEIGAAKTSHVPISSEPAPEPIEKAKADATTKNAAEWLE